MSGHRIPLDAVPFVGESPISPFGEEGTARARIDDLNSYEDGLVLIVDDDPDICEFLERMISQWGLKVETITSPPHVLYRVRNNSYNLVLLDVFMPEKSGMDLIPEILDVYPYAKIIVMTAFADKEIAINALRLGAFDFLEKPFKVALLHHFVKRALDTQKIELEYQKACENLQKSLKDVMDHKSKLETLNRQLTETNSALSVLAQNIDRARQETASQIVMKIRASIIPIVDRLQLDNKLSSYRGELDVMMSVLEELNSPMGIESKVVTTFTSTELRIATLIKNGYKTEQIAKHMCVSSSTVKTHRRNIRKKLKIRNSSHNLGTYLKANM